MEQERFAVGTIVGTGAAINVKCGFIPRMVFLQNITDTNYPSLRWYNGLGNGYGILEKTGTVYIARTIITSGGVTPYTGSDEQGGGQGFTLGTDTDMNGSADVIHYLAIR